MKKIEKPFAMSLYSSLEMASVKYELRKRHLKDLMFIKDKLQSGHFTAELYDFINADGCLEMLLPGLARPSSKEACESLQILQLSMINDIIANEELALGKWLTIIWNALKDYLNQWFDRNRFYTRNIRYYAALHRQYCDRYFGDLSKFNTTTVLMYHLDDWTEMLNASKKMLDIELPKKRADIEAWIQKNKPVITDCIAKFGMYIDEANKFKSGSPMFIRQHAVCSSLGWLYQNMGTNISNVISSLEDEITYRRKFYELEKLFTSTDNDAKRDANLVFVKSFVIASKNCSLIMARSFDSFLRQIIRVNSQVRNV